MNEKVGKVVNVDRGVGGATVLWVLWTATIMFDGSWSWRVGATAESWTADALRKFGREWRFFYNLPFYGGTIETPTWRTDIDCAAVGPGGVYAVSTKWTGDAWDLSDPTDDWVATAARQAARDAANLVPRVRNAVRGVEPVPVVVVWGPHLEDIAALRTIAAITVGERAWDVWVLNGRQARDWLRLMQSARLRPDEVTKVAGAAAALQSDYRDRAGRTATAVRDARSARFARALVATAATVSAADVVFLIAADTGYCRCENVRFCRPGRSRRRRHRRAPRTIPAGDRGRRVDPARDPAVPRSTRSLITGQADDRGRRRCGLAPRRAGRRRRWLSHGMRQPRSNAARGQPGASGYRS